MPNTAYKSIKGGKILTTVIPYQPADTRIRKKCDTIAKYIFCKSHCTVYCVYFIETAQAAMKMFDLQLYT